MYEFNKYSNAYLYASSKTPADIDFSRVDKSLCSGLLACKDFLPFDGFLNVPPTGVATITFYYGLVIFPDAENFINENGDKLEIHNQLLMEQTFKIKRNPNRVYDHNQLYYVYIPLWNKILSAALVVNYYSEKYNDYLSAKSGSISAKTIIFVNSLMSTMKSTTKFRIIGNYISEKSSSEAINEIPKMRYAVIAPTRYIYAGDKIFINSYYKDSPIHEYNYFSKNNWYDNDFVNISANSVSEFTFHDVEYPKIGKFDVRLTSENKVFQIEEGTSVSLYSEDFKGVLAIAKTEGKEKDLLKYGIMNVDFKGSGQLLLSYNGAYSSKTITINMYKKPKEVCEEVIVFGSSSISFTTKGIPSENMVKIPKDSPVCLYIFFSYGGTKIQILDLDSFALTLSRIFETFSSKVTLSTENTYDEPMMIRIQHPDNDEEKTFTINIENPYSVEKSYILSANSTYKSASSSELDKYVIPLEEETKKDEEEPKKDEEEVNNSSPSLSTPTNAPTNDMIQETPSNNKGKTIGIAVGVVAATLVIAAAIVVGFILLKKKQEGNTQNDEEINSDENKSENEMDI
ncbi:hypothetical protein TVAGG3_0710330 [Trichomonas vaginalis G3]|uniref:hypothetical protein n=1 Tax=Trichomonas vaginalis (strain ATCC PRA-98 / G3) TaxID=412133 RepID=UPI0021E5805C|nr:hypothetical protein TVAGG3_0710330 [Trichomonas vaginalis G3]KAI5509855.1 hypothetical protein TVAGG3_0710330 [Trichomonas vaginalis G3]